MAVASTKIGGTDVPAEYVEDVESAATALGIPASIVAAQIDYESGYNPQATSPTGAEGIAQFEPYTFSGLGISGSPYTPSVAFEAYVKYMGELLKQEKGDVYNTLAAYNAGPGDLSAGDGYAQHIFSQAGLFKGLKQGGTGQIGAGVGNLATEGGQGAAGTVTTTGAWTNSLGTAWNDVSSGLLTIPGVVLGTFDDVDKTVGLLYDHARLFFEPSTYVRIGAGVGGVMCLIAALVFTAKEAR